MRAYAIPISRRTRRSPGARLIQRTGGADRCSSQPCHRQAGRGKTVYGLINSAICRSSTRARQLAPGGLRLRRHGAQPARFSRARDVPLGLTDKAAIVSKGNLQPNVALFARFPQEADESTWVVKQALDIGLMGVIFNGVDTKEQAVAAVRSMRYPPLKGETRREPVGIRGYGTGGATWPGASTLLNTNVARCVAAESGR